MPRKKPSRQYKLHGWKRGKRNSKEILDRLNSEFGIKPKEYNEYWEKLLKKDLD